MYFTTEKSNSEARRYWEETGAKTLAGAKSVARKRQVFCGTVCAVGIKRGHTIEQVSHTRRDGSWNDI